MSFLSDSISFTAIDFETAQPQPNSICQVGLIRVVNGVIAQELNVLVQPPGNSYWGRFTQIHGIGPSDTFRSPTFEQVWPQIEPFISGQQVVAHNGLRFDFPVLDKTLQYYHFPVPKYGKHCTYKIYKVGLAKLCQQYSIPLQHHDALSDARACAILFLKHLNERTD